MKSFRIKIEIDRRYRYFPVDEIYDDGSIERYKLTRKNKAVVLQSNGPLLRAKGLKHKKVKWKLTEGIIQMSYGLNLVIDEIMKEIDG